MEAWNWDRCSKLFAHLSCGSERMINDQRSDLVQIMEMMASVVTEDKHAQGGLASPEEVLTVLDSLNPVSGFTSKDVEEAWEQVVKSSVLFGQELYSTIPDILRKRALPVYTPVHAFVY